MRELWKTVPNVEAYEVSNLGRVRRRLLGKGTRVGKVLKCYSLPTGYVVADMWMGGQRRRLYVHVAVLLAFRGAPPSDTHQGAHRDGRNSNNVLRNLRWATPTSNQRDKRRHGTLLKGSTHPNSKLTEAKVRKMRKLRQQGKTLHALAKLFKVCMQNVDYVCRRKTWGHVR